jgi:acetyl-CoA synthetase
MRRLLRSIARGEEITQDVSTLENPAIARAAARTAKKKTAGRKVRAKR